MALMLNKLEFSGVSYKPDKWGVRQVVKPSDFQSGDTGSTPVRPTTPNLLLREFSVIILLESEKGGSKIKYMYIRFRMEGEKLIAEYNDFNKCGVIQRITLPMWNTSPAVPKLFSCTMLRALLPSPWL